MENHRNRGVVNPAPPLHPPSEAYPQKRTSYRRPIDPQPAPSAPNPANAVPSNSARPVAATAPGAAPVSGALPPNGVSRVSSHRRRQSQQISSSAGARPEPILPAPDVPRGPPPTSYRDPYAPKGSSRSHGSARSYSGRPRDPTIQVNASRQQPTIQIAPDRLPELRAAPYTPAEPLTGAIEGQPRRPSVPDRSPLQKLEGKLDDISKEERRARMQELELMAQEKAEAEARARRAREAAAKQQRIVSGPAPIAERSSNAPPGRTDSARRHVSMPSQARSKPWEPDETNESDDGVVYDLSEPWDPSAGAPAGNSQHARPPVVAPYGAQSGAQRQKNRLSHLDGTVERKPSVKGKEPVGIARGSGSFRDRTAVPIGLDKPPPESQRVQRKPVASPKGLGLYDVEGAPLAARPAGASVSQYETKRLSKDLPATPKDSVHSQERKRDSRGIKAAQMEMEQQRLDQKNGTRGSNHPQPHDPPAQVRRGVGFAPSVPNPDPESSQESHHHHHLSDFFDHSGPERRYVAPTMLEEWKGAPIAVLGAEDLNLDVSERPDSTNKAWWEEPGSSRRRRSSVYAQAAVDGYVDEVPVQTTFTPPLYLKCGPLLRYTGMRKDKSKTGREREIWRGSVMIVTIDGQSSYVKPPTLRLFKQPMDLLPPPPAEIDAEGQELNPAYVDPIEGQTKVSRTGGTLYVKPIDEIAENEDLSRVEDDSGLFQSTRITSSHNGNSAKNSSRIRKKDGEKLGKMREIPGIRLHAERGVTFWRFNLEIELGPSQVRIAYRINRGPAIGFWVPARGETMNMMFYSCNGFSYSVDSKEFCGPDPMWRDVLNSHQTRPFHVMIGGGDQIYNDPVMRETTLFRQWTESRNPLQKHKATFSSELQNELEQFYLDRYSMWFSQGLYGMANSQIPMVNIWDDHDIIDGFGSYPHHFMSTPVFTGLGAVAFKYYMLFQHQSVAAETEKTEPSWLLGAHPGPYIKEQSRSVFMFLGKQVAFLGLDCRTERRREEIMTEDSYDVIFDRLEDEIVKGETKHLIVLLGVPIAYPRLNFLENILTSRIMDPIKAMGRAGLLGNFVNKFDGGVEILDDLDDHWTAKHHKAERSWLISELQHIASTKSVRVTILGGDVHLGAIGQFYSNKKLNIPKDKDHRYMPNVISSAIVNTPPPDLMADILNKRNKVHHLDSTTDEDMIPIFTHDVDGKKRNNTHLLPHRNWCSLREYKPGSTPPSTPSPPPSPGAYGPRLTRTLSDYTPGNMVRRMSASGKRGRDRAPPVSYYNNPANATADEELARVHSSFSPEREQRPRSRRNSLSSLFRRRASVDSVNPPGSAHSMPTPRNRTSFAPDDGVAPERPGPFHRRPSVLTKKGLKGGGQYINLEGGLDVCLNIENSQKDPAGITTPYRLLIPALHYTPPPPTATGHERRKSRIGSLFGALAPRDRRPVDDDQSHSGTSIASSDGAESDEEERARQRYKVGPRILIPGFSKKRNSAAAADANPPPTADRRISTSHDRKPHDHAITPSAKAGERTAATTDRRSSAPMSSYNATPALFPPQQTQTQTQTMPARSGSTRQPTYNSSHKSQLPAPEPKVYRRSMGGILNHPRDDALERDRHGALPPSQHWKRDSYPPHPAIVGAGPGSPYSRGSVEPRGDGYFASGGRSGNAADAGVGARYLGGGKYADGDDDSLAEDRYSDEIGEKISQDSFVPPKPKPRWKIWK